MCYTAGQKGAQLDRLSSSHEGRVALDKRLDLFKRTQSVHHVSILASRCPPGFRTRRPDYPEDGADPTPAAQASRDVFDVYIASEWKSTKSQSG